MELLILYIIFHEIVFIIWLLVNERERHASKNTGSMTEMHTGKPGKFPRDKDRNNGRELELLIISCGMVNHDDVISEEPALFADAISSVWSPNPPRTGDIVPRNVYYRNTGAARSRIDSTVNLFFPCAWN